MAVATSRVMLDVELPPHWERIDPLREAVAAVIAATFDDTPDLRQEVAMIAAELLENGVKYGRADALVRLTVEAGDAAISVSVGNAIDESAGHVAQLDARLAWIRSFATPEKAYHAALEQLYSAPAGAQVGSRLGLVRIAYEGGCDIAAETPRDGYVVVRAVRPLVGGAA